MYFSYPKNKKSINLFLKTLKMSFYEKLKNVKTLLHLCYK